MGEYQEFCGRGQSQQTAAGMGAAAITLYRIKKSNAILGEGPFGPRLAAPQAT
jgi:hypothetical protein